jgi:site-specific DNA-methyltransferase (adenine-specific)
LRLVAEGTPQEIVDGRNKTDAIRVWVRKAKLGLAAQQTAASAWILLEHRLGELLPAVLKKGRPKKIPGEDHFPTLRELGLTPNQSSRAQRIAAIPMKQVEAYFRDARRAGWEITLTGNTGLLYRAEINAVSDFARQREDIRARGFDLPKSRRMQRECIFAPRLRAVEPGGKPPPREKPELTHPPTVSLYLGDCLDLMPKKIPDHAVDMICADLPYEKTGHPWNRKLDLTALWREFRRVIKPSGVIALISVQPYTSELVMSALDWHRYEIIWVKNRPVNPPQAKHRPLRYHEDIEIFSAAKTRSGEGRMQYWPVLDAEGHYPKSVIYCPSDEGAEHPMQKPVALLRYLIELYTRPGELVLDCTMGSGSTGVAAIETGRSFVGIEKHQPFFEIARRRLGQAE